MASYADGNDLIARYDIDLVGDLATDGRETLDQANVPAHVNIIAALEDASGEIDAALKVGGRYTAEQLAGLTGNAAKHLKRICCAIAMCGLLDRRPEVSSTEYRERVYQRAKELLKSIKSGDNIFGLPEEVDAGVIDTGGPTVIEIEERNDLTARMGSYFPGAATRLPKGR